MTQSQGQIDKIVKQFPTVGDLLKKREEEKAPKAVVEVKVKKVDPDFFYSTPCDYLGQHGSIFNMKEEWKGALKHYLYYVLKDEKRGAVAKYDGDDFALALLRVYKSLWDKFFYLVECEILTKFVPPTHGEMHDGLFFGEYKSTKVSITVWTIPKEGLAYAASQADPRINVTLFSRLLMRGQLPKRDRYDEVWLGDQQKKFTETSELLHEACLRFKKEVFMKGMQALYLESKSGRVVGRCEDISFETTYGMGRFQVCLDMGNLSLNILGDDSESCRSDPPMNISELRATVPQAKLMVEKFVKSWESVPEEKRRQMFMISVDGKKSA